jgi:hypothetical protein
MGFAQEIESARFLTRFVGIFCASHLDDKTQQNVFRTWQQPRSPKDLK